MNGSIGSSGRSSPKMSSSQNVPVSSSRTSPYLTSAAAKHVMEAPIFVPQGQAVRQTNGSTPSYQLPLSAMPPFEGNVAISSTQPNPPPSTYPPAILIRRLPLKITEDSLRSMVVWSKEFIDAEVLSTDLSEDPGFRSAVLRFKSPAGAQEAQRMLNGKPNIANDAQMIVEIYYGSPTLTRRYPTETVSNGTFNAGPASSTSSTSSAGPTPRQSSRFNGTFQSMERISPTNNGVYATNELPNPDSGTHYQSLFSPQSPIGNHLSERPRISGKSLINNDSVDDDETGELLKDPVAYAESGSSSAQARRPTNPQLPISRMAGLSLSTTGGGVQNSMSGYQAAQLAALQPLSTPLSPTLLNSTGLSMHYQLGNQHYQRHNFPPVNPADQNPPCNTLYVGNLPIDTSEDELKAMFSKQRGYKRLCFRTKQNGPMCFVEFEDVSFATKALHELYGHPLHNSIKGGIRLSFSKNPLGVRSGQGPGVPGPTTTSGVMQGMSGPMMTGASGAGFSTANGPPPGLAAPPGLGPSRVQYGAVMNPMGVSAGQYGVGSGYGGNQGGWSGSAYGGPMVSQVNGANNGGGFPPAYMMGR